MFDEILKIDMSANTVAWYGAIVSTIAIIFNILSYLRDRSKVKVKISQGLLGYSHHTENNLQIFIEAINIGRRLVTLTGVGFSLKNRKNLYILEPKSIRFPCELQEGKSVQVWTDKKTLLRDVRKEKTSIQHAWYKDATGKFYKTKFHFK